MSKIDFHPLQYKKALEPKEVGKFRTPSALLQFGMCRCDHCGHLSSVDYKECLRCGEEIVIFKTKNSK